MNVIDIEDNVQKIVAGGFDPQNFIMDFAKAYDAPKSLIQQIKKGDQNLSDVQGAVLWRKNLHYKSAPKGQSAAILEELQRSQATSKYKSRFIISTDGEDFYARDLISGNTINCHFNELSEHFTSFLSLAGIFLDDVIEENPIDIKATRRLTTFYDTILHDNPVWRAEDKRHTLNHFITQIIFCLFAEDTGILPDNVFSDTLNTYCANNSDQVKPVLENLFTALANPAGANIRTTLPKYTEKFPHVNGWLFNGRAEVPKFTRGSARYLMDAAALDWKEINPDIFGSMIQAIVNNDQRGELGMHYTSVPNILKVITPLFLTDLKDEVQAKWNSKKGLQEILYRLMHIRVFDPACGSGNFLVISYRELREIEMQVMRRLSEISNYTAGVWSHVELRNFFGIEHADFAAETAKLSLWIAEYQMNKRFEQEFGKSAPSLPLKDANTIHNANALRIDWREVCPPSESMETYIVGNPPFAGFKPRTKSQQDDLDSVFEERLNIPFRKIDYVGCWFLLAADYISSVTLAKYAFVSTNSITQGEQAPIFAAILASTNCQINFGYTSFKWKNNASHNAGVSVIIAGVGRKNSATQKYLFDNKYSRKVKQINSYLIAGPDIGLTKLNDPISERPEMDLGSAAYDGQHLILNEAERSDLLSESPEAEVFICDYFGSQEFIRGTRRYCLWIEDDEVHEAKKIPQINQRLQRVQYFRKNCKRKATRDFSDRTHKFVESRRKGKHDILVIPIVSSERREYLPAGYVPDASIVSNKCFAMYNVPKWCFSLIVSKLHRSWVEVTSGRLKTDISYSNIICWNNFPIPELTDAQKFELNDCAEKILLARDYYFEHTIAELYDPDNMADRFPRLLKEHQKNDDIIETIYSGSAPFLTEAQRLDHLFNRYAKLKNCQ